MHPQKGTELLWNEALLSNTRYYFLFKKKKGRKSSNLLNSHKRAFKGSYPQVNLDIPCDSFKAVKQYIYLIVHNRNSHWCIILDNIELGKRDARSLYVVCHRAAIGININLLAFIKRCSLGNRGRAHRRSEALW